jgi:hypothetical protein
VADRKLLTAHSPPSQVVLDGQPSDADWKASAKWSNTYLARQAGEAPLRVEKREGTNEGFGKGKKVPISFGEFLQRMDQGDDTLYLTTQEVCMALSCSYAVHI